MKEWVVKQVKRSRKGKAGEDGEQHRAVVLLADEEREEEEAVGGVEGKREGVLCRSFTAPLLFLSAN